MAKAVGRGQGRGGIAKGRCGIAKAVGAWPRTWGRGQGLWGVAKAARVNPNPNSKAVDA